MPCTSFSAAGLTRPQLAYYEKHPSQFIDAVYGPSELFLYGIDKLITKFELAHEYVEKGNIKGGTRFVLEDSMFHWIDRRTCLAELNEIPVEIFVDACLLAGSSILRTFPPLENSTLYPKGCSFRDVVTMVVSCGRNITALCAQYQDDPQIKELDYLDRYRRASTGIKHHIVINKDGDVETLDKERAPSDVHDCIGQRLPEELNMYLSRGMIRPRVLNWLTSGTILVTAPCEGGDSREYQNLVRTQLEPFRRQALCLLSECLSRYYQRKEITTRFWFDGESASKVNLRDLLPSPKESLNSWIVRDDSIAEQRRKLEVRNPHLTVNIVSDLMLADANREYFASFSRICRPQLERWNLRFEGVHPEAQDRLPGPYSSKNIPSASLTTASL